jgi:hypothetical protein
MNWYVAKIIFRIVSGEGNHQPQFDEQLRLVSASDEKQALEKACNMGRQNQDQFQNSNKQTVQWQFVDVVELNPVNNLQDGAELYYNIHETPDPELYIKWAHHKSALLSGITQSTCY